MLSLFPGVIVDEQFAASFRHSVGVLWHDLVGITCKNHQKMRPMADGDLPLVMAGHGWSKDTP